MLIYFIGMLVALSVFRVRAGLGFWHGLALFGPGGVGLEWLAINTGKAMVWPVTAAVWLATDRPEPAIVFNEKAVARRAAQQQN